MTKCAVATCANEANEKEQRNLCDAHIDIDALGHAHSSLQTRVHRIEMALAGDKQMLTKIIKQVNGPLPSDLLPEPTKATAMSGPNSSNNDEAIASIAISLKRLADAAEGARPPVHWHVPAGAIVRAVGESIMIDPATDPKSELVDVGLREAVARAITELEDDENSRLPVAAMLRRAAR